MKYLLEAVRGSGDARTAFYNEYDSAEKLHAAWYRLSHSLDSEGRYNYKVRCWQEIDPRELPL
jgi:hypothetical protein